MCVATVRKLTNIVKANKSDIHIIGSYNGVGTLVGLVKEHPTALYVPLVFQLLSILVCYDQRPEYVSGRLGFGVGLPEGLGLDEGSAERLAAGLGLDSGLGLFLLRLERG